MLMENYNTNYSKYGHMSLRNVDKNMCDWLESVIQENHCSVERKEWVSKFNTYVVYDYEPFCSDGFEINYLVSSCDYTYLNFVKYLYDKKMNEIEYLNNCLGY